MSNDLIVNSSVSPTALESRHIYPQNNLHFNRQHSVDLIPPTNLETEDYENNAGRRLIQKKNLRVGFDENVRQNYDPWRDIYLRGDFDRQRFDVRRRKTDRKSKIDYADYDNDKFEDEYVEYVEEDEDLPAYNRRPYSADRNLRRKRPSKVRRNQVSNLEFSIIKLNPHSFICNESKLLWN